MTQTNMTKDEEQLAQENLRKKWKGRDVQFHIEDTIVLANKYILSLRSTVFKRQFYGFFRESSSSNTMTSIIVEDAEPEVFRFFIKCFYEDVDFSDKNIHFLADLYHLADKYQMEGLKVGKALFKAVGL